MEEIEQVLGKSASCAFDHRPEDEAPLWLNESSVIAMKLTGVLVALQTKGDLLIFTQK